jgi:hypothetical protein
MVPVGFGCVTMYRPINPSAENNLMKHVLNSVAIAAALAITVPALAQAQTSGAPPEGSVAAPPTGGHPMGHATTARKHRPQRPTYARRTASPRVASAGRGAAAASPTDNVANQLNGQELQRLETGPAPAGMTAPGPVMTPGPRVSGGGNIRSGVSGPVSAAPGVTEEGPRTSGGGNIAAPTGPMPMPPPPPISAPVR